MKSLHLLLGSLALGFLLLISGRVLGVPERAGDPTEGSTYIGEAACKKCHMKEHRTWGKMKHSSAWEVLDEQHRNMTAQNDEGRTCLSCHVTGWEEADRGGFIDPVQSEHLLGVQCEACHGPGSKHKEAGQKVLDEKRKDFDEGEPSFMVLRTTKCADCHNPHVSHAKYKKAG